MTACYRATYGRTCSLGGAAAAQQEVIQQMTQSCPRGPATHVCKAATERFVETTYIFPLPMLAMAAQGRMS